MTQDLSKYTFISTFESDDILKKYGQNALALFVMQLYIPIENIETFAADAITDGADDKKIDLCHIDINSGIAIIAQNYFSKKWGRDAAKGDKASDIHTGITWLLSADIDDVPEKLTPKALELRDGIRSGEITRIEILYTHNCFSSTNVKQELKASENLTLDLSNNLTNNKAPDIFSREFGIEEIEELYKSKDNDILVDEWLEVPATNYIEEKQNNWEAIVTSVPASWIRELRIKHGDALVSANFRSYLGTRASTGNINNQIKQTVASEPENFWVFNNGITALTHTIKNIDGKIKIYGISIINGAQTSGAIGDAEKDGIENAKVLIRLVKSNQSSLITKIIRFNNTQNKFVPADRRSNEEIFKNLQKDFSQKDIEFVIRRSQNRNPKNSISSSDIARVLAAFHGRPQLGYRNPSSLANIYCRIQAV